MQIAIKALYSRFTYCIFPTTASYIIFSTIFIIFILSESIRPTLFFTQFSVQTQNYLLAYTYWISFQQLLPSFLAESFISSGTMTTENRLKVFQNLFPTVYWTTRPVHAFVSSWVFVVVVVDQWATDVTIMNLKQLVNLAFGSIKNDI